jgi:hypothetical protein
MGERRKRKRINERKEKDTTNQWEKQGRFTKLEGEVYKANNGQEPWIWKRGISG